MACLLRIIPLSMDTILLNMDTIHPSMDITLHGTGIIHLLMGLIHYGTISILHGWPLEFLILLDSEIMIEYINIIEIR